MDALRATLDSTEGQVATVSRTGSPPPSDILTPSHVAEYWCHTQVRVTKMKYVWTISNFSFCREEMGEVVKSSYFSCTPNDKLKWCLRINPKGLDEESRDYLSLYLLLVNCGTKTEARAKFKFSILNSKREETKAMESQRAYRFVQGKDWGFKKFIRRDVLLNEANGLLPNDRLTILCEVAVVGETLCEDGQVKNRPISVPGCNLQDDLGNLLYNQTLTDVTLVVLCRRKKKSRSKLPVDSQSCRIPGFRRIGYFDVNDDKELNDEEGAENSEDSVELSDDFNEDESDTGVYDDTDDDEINNNNDDDDVQFDYSTTKSVFSMHRDVDEISKQDQGEAESAQQNLTTTTTTSVDFYTSSSTFVQSSASSSGLTSVSTSNRLQTALDMPPMVWSMASRDTTTHSSHGSGNQQTNPDWQLTSSPNLNRIYSTFEEHNGKNDSGVCEPSQKSSSCSNPLFTFNHVPATTESSLPTSNSDVVGSSSTSSNTVAFQSSSSVYSKDSLVAEGESFEVETSGAMPNIRQSSRHRNTPSVPNTIRFRNQFVLNEAKAAPTTIPSSSTADQPLSCTSVTAIPLCSKTTLSASTGSSITIRRFEAHKAILAARSPVFAAMFGHQMEESLVNRVEIKDIKPRTLTEVLRYIYTGQVIGLDRIAQDLIAAADKYQLERLKLMCEESLIESLYVDNACNILGLADMYNAEQLKKHTLEFIMLHANDICETEGYDHLVRHRPRLLNECFRSLASQQMPIKCLSRKRPRPSIQ